MLNTRRPLTDGSRRGSPAAMILSPNLIDVRLTGYLDAESWLLEPHSRLHNSTLPSLLVTSIRRKEWGFRQMNSLTTPSTSTRLVLS